MSESKRYTGTVKWFNPHKGFGFITPDPNNSSDDAAAPPDDLFVHYTSILSDGFRTLYDGQPVEFSLEFSQEDARSKAVEVSVLDRSHGGGRGGRGWYSGRGGGRGGGGGRRGGYGGGMGGGGGGGGVECYNCGRVGHLARDCCQGQGGSGGRGGGWGRGGRRYGGGGGGGRGEGSGGREYGGGGREYGGGDGYGGGRGGGRRGCFNCGEEGHLARDCPNYGDN